VLRALGTFNEVVRGFAAKDDERMVADLESAFIQASGPNGVGLDLFFDYCHPNSQGHKLAAQVMLKALHPFFRHLVLAPDLVETELGTTNCPEDTPEWTATVAYALAMTHANNGSPREAEKHYLAALKARPRFTEALSNLALLLLQRNADDEARALLKQAVEADPLNISATYLMGYLCMLEEKWAEAQEWEQKAVALNPNHAEAQDLLGDIAAHGRQWELATQSYKRSLASGNDSAQLHVKLGDVLAASGHPEEARRHWQEAVRIDPAENDARERIATGAPSQSAANRVR
jgi:tetratricopeptide (TPR) repeat protein